MSIRLSNKYPGKISAPDANYQDGSIQNETTPDVSDDGTPLDFEWGNDFEGLKQRLILMSGITPSDSSDTSLGGDILDALFGEASPFKPQPTFPAAMQVKISKGTTGGATQAEQTSSAITAPSVNPRIDVIVIDASTGAIGIVAGAESASPVAPAITGIQRGIAQVALVVAQTSIVDSDITDIRQMIKGPSTSDITSENIVPSADADVILTEAQYTADRQVFADGSWAASHSAIFPDEARRYFADNSAGTYDVLAKTAAGTGVTVAAGDSAMLVCDGTNIIDPLTGQAAVTAEIIHAQDQKASGTAGGASVAGSYQTRDFTTVVSNTIAGASLAANQITLPAGTYKASSSAPSYQVESHKAKLYDTTGAADLLIGTTEKNRSGVNIATSSTVRGVFTLSVESDIELQHITTNAKATDGLGFPSSFGDTEIYSDVLIEKIG